MSSDSSEPIDLGQGARLRRAERSDLGALLQIRRELPMPSSHIAPGEARDPGFLLGSDELTYAELLSVARVWLLEAEGAAIGFTVTLTDSIFRASSLWAERASIAWRAGFDAELELARPLAYFDQLAVLPHARRREWSAALALCALGELIETEAHELVLTTTVVEPVVNRSALPYLAHLGARRVGQLDERYAGVGEIVSALHMIEAEGYRSYVEGLVGSPRPDIQLVSRALARAARARDPQILDPPGSR